MTRHPFRTWSLAPGDLTSPKKLVRLIERDREEVTALSRRTWPASGASSSSSAQIRLTWSSSLSMNPSSPAAGASAKPP